MRFMNFASKPSNIKMAFLVSNQEFNSKNIERNLLSLIPEDLRDTVLVLTLDKNDMQGQVIDKLKQLPANCTISISDISLYKFITKSNKLPKLVGKLSDWGDKQVQYFYYTSKALYMLAALENNEKCMNHVLNYVMTGEKLVLQLPRKMIEPSNEAEVKKAFRYLMKRDVVGSDIEATSLKFYKAKLVSISFAIDAQRGYSFHVKKCNFIPYMVAFFKRYKGRIAWHNGSYDLKVLAHLYFNGDSRELYRTYEDTMFMHYMLTNSPERFARDLGTLVVDLCGEYKLTNAEYADMMNVDVTKCNEYNLDDARGTIWLYNQLRPKLYSEYFYYKMKKWQWYLTQVELAGMPVSKKRLGEVDEELTKVLDEAVDKLLKQKPVIEAMGLIRDKACDKYNATHVKQKEPYEFDLSFNPNSNDQISTLFFDVMGLPVIKKTPSGAPKVDSKCQKVLSGMCKDKHKVIFELLETIALTGKMVGTFVKAVKDNTFERNGWLYLHGSFNLARVVSGRLSSSDPNLQNLPSGSKLSKIFKSIFIAPKGYLWGGADFNALEDRINTVLTQDPNKLDVYTSNMDGHSWRCVNYLPEQVPDIVTQLNALDVEAEDYKAKRAEIVNQIMVKYEVPRKTSKSPYFLLQYMGSAYGLQENCGFSRNMANTIYANHHKMYEASDIWLSNKLHEVADKGYATLAYGLRLHCYGITRVILDSKYTPKSIQEAIRTIGNAIGGQSYGQMNVDAGYKFLMKVYEAGLQNRVWVVGTIHDATYLMWEDDPELTAWVNHNLTTCMADISELPELQNSIPFPADLDIYCPSWKDPVTLKGSNLTANEITQRLEEGRKELANA